MFFVSLKTIKLLAGSAVMGKNSKLVIISTLVFFLLPSAVLGEQEEDQKEGVVDANQFLWSVPEKGSFILSPVTGWAIGEYIQGFSLGIRALFFFKYLVGSVQGQGVFTESGTVYDFGVDIYGRYGPFFAGVGFAGHWLPGKTNTTTPGVVLKAGIHTPTWFDAIFLEISYRPCIILIENRSIIYHTIMLGFLFETDDNEQD